jgi:hypothetical protein
VATSPRLAARARMSRETLVPPGLATPTCPVGALPYTGLFFCTSLFFSAAEIGHAHRAMRPRREGPAEASRASGGSHPREQMARGLRLSPADAAELAEREYATRPAGSGGDVERRPYGGPLMRTSDLR